MAHVRGDVRLVIAGQPESPAYAQLLRDALDRHGLHDRVDLRLGWLPQDEMDELIATARAVLYVPVDEDSYGYPSLEAAAHARPVVTTTDSGGALEFVEDGRSGLVVAPDPRALALAFDRLAGDDALARSMGAACRERVGELRIDWDHVVHSLLAASS
jgi:glycosyltransferase involved in cell wall biosynthesis